MSFDKPNYKKYQHFLDQCYIPYDIRCYDWNVLYILLSNAKNRVAEDSGLGIQSLVDAIQREVYG